ncbi:uncharacterized protein LOC127263093 [Andrographis paniculata]|uniref:uncharacterized protein LOC127263093 n=1 Tax=Andrographis paniculata TaxID=175694 RepID=UPI0021E854F3|nr:uncharacterized protein LOC127263093 [Andrographis paniculata]
MAFRGRGRGRGGFGRGGFAKQVPFELFPEIEDLGTAEYSQDNLELIRWSSNLQKFCQTSSPYYYEDRTERLQKKQKQDIETYSSKNLGATYNRPPLWDFIKLDNDHMPAELARGENKGKRTNKKVRWNPESDFQKLDMFEKLEQKFQGEEGTEKKEDEEEEDEEDEVNEEDGEFSDEGDYEQAEYFDDDEDDYNIADDNDDEPIF